MRYLLFVILILVQGCGLRAQEVNVLHYSFIITLDPHHDTVKGTAVIQLVDKSNTGLVQLDLVSVNTQGKGMLVKGVKLSGQKTRSLSFSQDKEKLLIKTPDASLNDTLVLSIEYSGIPADGLVISKNRFGDRTFFADNWPNRAHHWIPCNDRPDDKAAFEFIVNSDTSYQVISNGIKQKEQVFEKNWKYTHWREESELSTKVMVIGAAPFAVKYYEDSPPGIPVSAWIFKQDSTRGFYDYAAAPSILKFFSSYIAPYPFKKLANVQSKTIFGGMENASAIFYNETSVTGKAEVEDLLAHEIVHQWFGDMASEKSFTHLWLSEGFATYLTNIYLETKYGSQRLEERMREDRKQVIEFARTSKNPVVDSLLPFMELLNANSYQKGGWVLHMLRQEVGDTIFQKIIRNYYESYKGSNADTRDFERIAETVSKKELTWFFDQWLYQPGLPKLKVRYRAIKPNTWQVEIEQEGNFRFPLVIGTTVASKRVVRVFDVTARKQSFIWQFSKRPDSSPVLDPYTQLLFEGTVIKK